MTHTTYVVNVQAVEEYFKSMEEKSENIQELALVIGQLVKEKDSASRSFLGTWALDLLNKVNNKGGASK